MKQTFIQGALILILATFITKLLGFANRIVMARLMGPEGVGLYMMAVPILTLVITLTRLGLPIAISKLTAEAEAKGDFAKIRQILIVSLCMTLLLSILFTFLTIGTAPLIAGWLLTDERAYLPLLAITPIIPIVAVSSVLKGYFQGRQNMKPPAYSLIIEQVTRIIAIALLVQLLLPYGVEYAAAGAMASAVLGEGASLLYLAATFKYGRRPQLLSLGRGIIRQLKRGKTIIEELLRIGLPATGSGLIGSLSWTLEPILVAQSLALAGIASAQATKAYGLLAGYAIPLLMLPMFITYSLSVSLVPAISEAQATRNRSMIKKRLHQTMRLSLICGAPATVIMLVFAEPLVTLIYGTPQAAPLLKTMAPFFLFLYFQSPLQAALQGLDLAKTAMLNTLYGSLVKMGAIVLLASRPELGIFGAALAININICLVTLLHFFSLAKAVNTLFVQVKDFLKAGVAMGLMAVGGKEVFLWIGELFPHAPSVPLLSALAASLFIYGTSLFFLKLVERDDVERIPFIGKKLTFLFPKR